MSLTKNLQELREQEAVQAKQMYHRLLRTAGERELAAHELAELDRAARTLGISPAQVETDAVALRNAGVLQQRMAGLDQAQMRADAGEAALRTYQEETDRLAAELLDSRELMRAKLEAELTQAKADLSLAREASKTLRELERQHHELLGAPDPELEARKAYLSHWWARLPEGLPYPLLVVEGYGNPGASQVRTSPRDYDFELLPGQTREELDALVNLADRFHRSELPDPLYVYPDDGREYAALSAVVQRWCWRVKDLIAHMLDSRHPRRLPGRTILPGPGVSVQDFDKLREEVEAADLKAADLLRRKGR